jgi:hypothetical protein
MEIKFIKDHNQYKAGEVVKDHPNAEYLLRVKAAEIVVKKEKVKKES